jgi:nicotinamidase-related amidase
MELKLTVNTESTALVIIDLQKGIVSMPAVPHSSEQVLNRTNSMIKAFHKNNALVIFVRVAFSADRKNALNLEVDERPFTAGANLPANWSEIIPELEMRENDIIVTKRQWGAFYGTELDMELRRRGIKTIVLCGIATNYGVESTARDAYERGYNIIFAEDAMSSRNADDRNFAITRIFSRIGRVRKTQEVLDGIG